MNSRNYERVSAMIGNAYDNILWDNSARDVAARNRYSRIVRECEADYPAETDQYFESAAAAYFDA